MRQMPYFCRPALLGGALAPIHRVNTRDRFRLLARERSSQLAEGSGSAGVLADQCDVQCWYDDQQLLEAVVSEAMWHEHDVTRDALAAELARRHAAGESIRALAASTGRSYGFVYRILSESGAIARSRPSRPPRTDRLGLRVSAEQADLIREAAALEGKTVSAFVVDIVTSHARQVVSDHRDLVLSQEAFHRFYAELDQPAEAVPELAELFRRQSRLGSGASGE